MRLTYSKSADSNSAYVRSIPRIAALVGCLFLTAPLSAIAQTTGNNENGNVPPPITEHDQGADILSGIALLGGTICVMADATYAVEGSWISPAWSWTQIGFGTLNVAASIAQFAADKGSFGLGVASSVMGASLIGYATASLFLYEPKAPKGPVQNVDKLARADDGVKLGLPSFGPLPQGGGVAMISGIF